MDAELLLSIAAIIFAAGALSFQVKQNSKDTSAAEQRMKEHANQLEERFNDRMNALSQRQEMLEIRLAEAFEKLSDKMGDFAERVYEAVNNHSVRIALLEKESGNPPSPSL